MEDVLIQVDKFYYPVDFVVLDTKPIAVGANYVPIILGRQFLATSNVIIKFSKWSYATYIREHDLGT